MNYPTFPLLVALGCLWALDSGTVWGSTPEAAPQLTLAPCQLEDPARVSVVQAECGDLSAPENPASDSAEAARPNAAGAASGSAGGGAGAAGPAGSGAEAGRIRLRVARVPGINRRKQPDPLFVLAGGPGMAATTFYASVASAFERIHRDRDIILVDQRGTGRSNPLNCKTGEDDIYRAGEAELTAAARQCLTELEKSAHVEFYTTSVAVQDLDLVRSALGYQRINLYGASYGTRVAQHYVRRFPEHTRSVILDGVVPPTLALGPDTALNAERALSQIFARCAHEGDCSKRFGDVSASYMSLRRALEAHPVSVSLADPTSGEPARLDFTAFHLATVLRLASYTTQQAALLPLMLHAAWPSAPSGAGAGASPGNFTPLASQFLLVNRSYDDVVSTGMHNSVVCSEDVPFWETKAIDRAALEKTYLGTAQVDGLRSICSVWPRGPVDPDFHAPLHSEVPALLLSGGDDPVTPPSDAEVARRGFIHNAHVVLSGFGHGQLVAPCVDHVMAAFVQAGRVEGLDTSCVKNDLPMPFFVTLGGPSP